MGQSRGRKPKHQPKHQSCFRFLRILVRQLFMTLLYYWSEPSRTGMTMLGRWVRAGVENLSTTNLPTHQNVVLDPALECYGSWSGTVLDVAVNTGRSQSEQGWRSWDRGQNRGRKPKHTLNPNSPKICYASKYSSVNWIDIFVICLILLLCFLSPHGKYFND